MLKCSSGFTLIEVLLAIFIISLGGGAGLALIQRTISSVSVYNLNFTAAYLAQEGIEIVRNVRDTNWLQARVAASPWNDGLPAGNYQADYTTVTFGPTANFEICTSPGWNCDVYDGELLRFDGNFYRYFAVSGTLTPFSRRITITSFLGNDAINVSVDVFWKERGRSHTLNVQENLYNWKP